MVNWILIVVLIIAALIILKFKEIRHQAGMLIGLAILVFIVVTFGTLSVNYDIDLNSFDGFMYATKLYVVWLKHTFVNIADITGYTINRDWSLNTTILNASTGR